jgi:Large polyvalent protein-associated domain 7
MASTPNEPKKPKRAKKARRSHAPGTESNTLKPQSPSAAKSGRARREATSEENTIRVRRARSQATSKGGERPTADPEVPKAVPPSDSSAVPAHIHSRYIKVGHQYHFTNGDPAFADRGRGLSTRLENTEVIRDLIVIAKERGWNDIAIKGTERFRKEAWQQASLAGLTVRGYRATELERALLARRLGRDREEDRDAPTTSHTNPSDRPQPRPTAAEEAVRAEARGFAPAPDRVQAGRLLDHGTANYQHDRHAELSYFVNVETPAGERTLWGKDLKRAVEQSLSRVKPGDSVTVRQLGTKPVTVVRAIRDEEGQIVEKREVQTHLNRWSVERTDFLAERAQVADLLRNPGIDARTGTAKRPELAGTYTELHAAKLIAQELFAHPADRERFITRVREAIADEIERGEPLSAPRVRNRTRDQRQSSPRSPDRAQERVLS